MTPVTTLRDRILAVRGADVAVALYIFLSVVFEDGSTPTKIARVLIVAAAVLETTVKPFKGSLVLLWQLLFVLFAAASTTWAYSGDHAERMALTLLINGVCIVALVYLVMDDPLRLRIFFSAMMIAPPFLMAKVGLEHGLLVFLDSRLAGETSANIVGMVAAFGFGLAYLSLTRGVLVSHSVAVALLTSNLLVVALSASRKAITMVALIVVVFALINSNFGGSRRVLKVASAASLGLFGYWLIMNIGPLYRLVGHRMNTMINGFTGSGEVDASTATRLTLIERGVGWFGERPWFGHGGDNFRALMGDFHSSQSAFYAHNNFVEIAVNFGIVGFILFYWMYAVIVGVGLKRRSRLNSTQAMVLSLVVTLLIMEYGAIDYYNRIFMAFLGVAWVAVCTQTLRGKDEDRDVLDAPHVLSSVSVGAGSRSPRSVRINL